MVYLESYSKFQNSDFYNDSYYYYLYFLKYLKLPQTTSIPEVKKNYSVQNKNDI